MKLEIASKSAKQTFEASSLIDGELTWTTERSGVAGKLDFDLIKNGGISYLEGDQVKFLVDKMSIEAGSDPLITQENVLENLFKGYVFKKSKSQESIKTTCYDQFVYLKQCKQSYNFQGKTVNDVITLIGREFGLAVSPKMEKPGYVMPEKIYKDKTLLDIITDCMSITNVATGKIYVFYDDFGELMLKESSNMKHKLSIGSESLATEYTYTTSLENTYNHIKIVQANKKSGGGDAYIVQDLKAIEDWGFLQYYEAVDENLNAAQIQEKAKQLFEYYDQRRRTLKLTAIGVPEVRAGSMVMINIPELGDINLSKTLLIDKCTHHFTSGSHTMDLEMEVYNG